MSQMINEEKAEKYKEEKEAENRALISQIEELLKCEICYQNFDLNIHLPMVAKCGHTFCKKCIYNGGENSPKHPFYKTSPKNLNQKTNHGVCPIDNIHHVLSIETCISNLKLESIIKKIFNYKEPKITEKKIVYHVEPKMNNNFNNSPSLKILGNKEFRSNSGNKHSQLSPNEIFKKDICDINSDKKNHTVTNFKNLKENHLINNLNNLNVLNDEIINDDRMNFMGVNQINDESIEAIPINEERSMLNNSFKDEFNELLTKNNNFDEKSKKNKDENDDGLKNTNNSINKNENNNIVDDYDFIENFKKNKINDETSIKRKSAIYDRMKVKSRKTISQETDKRNFENNSTPKKEKINNIKKDENKLDENNNKIIKGQQYKILSKKIGLKKNIESNNNNSSNSKNNSNGGLEKENDLLIESENNNKKIDKKFCSQKFKQIVVNSEENINGNKNIGTKMIFSSNNNNINGNLKHNNKSSSSFHNSISAYNKKRLPGKSNLFLSMKNNYCNSLNNSNQININRIHKNVSSISIGNIQQFMSNNNNNNFFYNKDSSLSLKRKKEYNQLNNLNNKFNKVNSSLSPGTKNYEDLKHNHLNGPSPTTDENSEYNKFKKHNIFNEDIIENKNESAADSITINENEDNKSNDKNSKTSKTSKASKISEERSKKRENLSVKKNENNGNNKNINGMIKSININLNEIKSEKNFKKRYPKIKKNNKCESPNLKKDNNLETLKNNLKSDFKLEFTQKLETINSKKNSQLKDTLINNRKIYEEFVENTINDPKNEKFLKNCNIEFLQTGELFIGQIEDESNLPLKGVTLSLSGDFYEGTFVGGKKEGKGTMIYKNGTRYEGAFKKNKHNGFGKLIQLDGETFIGEWKDGKINGNGVRYHKNGDKYIGAYINNIRNGLGHYIFSNGDSYEGNWINGKANGEGKFNFKNGNVYEGEFKDNIISGKGSFKMKNGDLYNGNFQNGLINGKGNIVYENGEKYVGYFQNGKKSGKGKVFDKDGNVIISGYWKNDKYLGNKCV